MVDEAQQEKPTFENGAKALKENVDRNSAAIAAAQKTLARIEVQLSSILGMMKSQAWWFKGVAGMLAVLGWIYTENYEQAKTERYEARQKINAVQAKLDDVAQETIRSSERINSWIPYATEWGKRLEEEDAKTRRDLYEHIRKSKPAPLK